MFSNIFKLKLKLNNISEITNNIRIKLYINLV